MAKDKEQKKKHTPRPPKKPLLPPDPPEGPPPTPPDFPPLADDEERFVQEWQVDRHPTRAYQRANPGLSTRNAAARARTLLQRPHVLAEMRAVRHAQRLRCQVSADALLEEVARVAFADVLELFDPNTGLLRLPRQIPLETRKAISRIKVSRERRTITTTGSVRTVVADTVVEYTFWNKMDAAKALFEHLGLRTSITPLEAFLAALPEPLQSQVRAALANNPLPPNAVEPK